MQTALGKGCIAGPRSLRFLKKPQSPDIILFGDRHAALSIKNCPTELMGLIRSTVSCNSECEIKPSVYLESTLFGIIDTKTIIINVLRNPKDSEYSLKGKVYIDFLREVFVNYECSNFIKKADALDHLRSYYSTPKHFENDSSDYIFYSFYVTVIDFLGAVFNHSFDDTVKANKEFIKVADTILPNLDKKEIRLMKAPFTLDYEKDWEGSENLTELARSAKKVHTVFVKELYFLVRTKLDYRLYIPFRTLTKKALYKKVRHQFGGLLGAYVYSMQEVIKILGDCFTCAKMINEPEKTIVFAFWGEAHIITMSSFLQYCGYDLVKSYTGSDYGKMDFIVNEKTEFPVRRRNYVNPTSPLRSVGSIIGDITNPSDPDLLNRLSILMKEPIFSKDYLKLSIVISAEWKREFELFESEAKGARAGEDYRTVLTGPGPLNEAYRRLALKCMQKNWFDEFAYATGGGDIVFETRKFFTSVFVDIRRLLYYRIGEIRNDLVYLWFEDHVETRYIKLEYATLRAILGIEMDGESENFKKYVSEITPEMMDKKLIEIATDVIEEM
jgi:hypothetical protein